MGMSIKLAEARETTPAPMVLGPHAQAMREAAISAITIEDIEAIVRKQVEKAKEGDRSAAKFVLDYATGGVPHMQVSLGIRGRPPKGEQPAIDGRPEPTVGEQRKRIARYLRKNGPTPEEELCELFALNGEADAVLGHFWFGRCKSGLHLTKLGREESA